MLDAAATASLVYLLSVAVFVLVRIHAGALGAARLTALIAGAVAIGLWLLVPGVGDGAGYEIALLARRLGVVAGGAGAALAYVSLRREDGAPLVLRIAAPLLIATGGFLAPANWIAGAAATVIAASAARLR